MPVKIKYVGVKEVAHDLWYGSGATWNGNGDVKEVADGPAARLLKHPDEFQVADDKPPKPPKKSEPSPLVPLAGDELVKAIESATKDDIEAFVKQRFNVDLDKRHAIQDLRDQAIKLVAEGSQNPNAGQ